MRRISGSHGSIIALLQTVLQTVRHDIWQFKAVMKDVRFVNSIKRWYGVQRVKDAANEGAGKYIGFTYARYVPVLV